MSAVVCVAKNSDCCGDLGELGRTSIDAENFELLNGTLLTRSTDDRRLATLVVACPGRGRKEVDRAFPLLPYVASNSWSAGLSAGGGTLRILYEPVEAMDSEGEGRFGEVRSGEGGELREEEICDFVK